MVDVINVDGDVAKYNASKLNTSAGELPPATAVADVDGNRTEPAASAFTTQLRAQTGLLGSEIEGLRQFIADNAEALTHAVTTLRETDQMTASAADQATALIDDVLSAPPATGVAGGAGNGASGADDPAGAARRAFGGGGM